MKKVILIHIILILIIFQNCEKKKTVSKTELPKTDTDTIKIKKDSIIDSPRDTINTTTNNSQYSINVEAIDSIEYNSAKLITNPQENSLIKITNFKEAKKLLKGVVEFTTDLTFDENQAITKIHFRNGQKYENTNDYDYFFFIAYFPQEDIILCEGGHTTDISFNLKNGEQTEQTGNPDLITSSPKKEFRLNGHYNGQECYSYFIQKKIDNRYEKIIQLDEEFKKITKIWLCVIGKSFWADEKTLFLYEDLNKLFFKISIIENKNFR